MLCETDCGFYFGFIHQSPMANLTIPEMKSLNNRTPGINLTSPFTPIIPVIN